MSSLPYIQQLTKVIVAQISQTIGWNSIQSTPLELLTDILHKYLEQVTRQTQSYTELYGRTEPNLDDVALAFNHLNINIADLEEYISNVDSVPCIINVPKFPIPKASYVAFSTMAHSLSVVSALLLVLLQLSIELSDESPPPYGRTLTAIALSTSKTSFCKSVKSIDLSQCSLSSRSISEPSSSSSSSYSSSCACNR